MDLVALLPWDDPVRGIASGFRDDPPYSYVTGPVTKVRAPVPIRVDSAGGLHLLSATHEIVHLASDGTLRARTPLPHSRVVDFVCDAAGSCIVLGEGTLTRFDAKGTAVWSRDVGDRYAHVLLDEASGQVYLRVKHSPELIELDRTTLRLHEQAGTAFLVAGKIGYAYYDEARNTRGIRVTSLHDGHTDIMPGSADHFAWLVDPFGMDGRSRLYTHREGRVARIALDGTIEEIAMPEGSLPPVSYWQVDANGRVVIAVTTAEGLAIRRSTPADG